MLKKKTIFMAIAGVASLAAMPALAQETEVTAAQVQADTAAIFNTLLFLIGGFLVMWMAAGFAMLEAGLVRSKNVSMQCLKNIGLYSVSGLAFWFIGYNMLYNGVGDNGGWFGTPGPYSIPGVGEETMEAGYSVGSDWFFQMVFAATTASIVSGTLAERIKIWPFIIFTAILTGIIYPLQASWEWGGGWLDGMGFSDFAGSTLVHSVGGWCALTGALILGARAGKYNEAGRPVAMPGSSIPLATLGTFILWLGWFGFNGGSQLALGTIGDAGDVSRIFINTNIAAASGVVVVMVLLQILYGKIDVTMALNGALEGLVAITAEPLTPSVPMAVLIGGIGGAIVVFTVPMLDRFKIDDVVGAIPVHLIAGIWGTLVVPLTNADATFYAQFVGVLAFGVFSVVASAIVWFILKATMGIRATEEDESLGLDRAEVGVEAYPEFT